MGTGRFYGPNPRSPLKMRVMRPNPRRDTRERFG
jgi:hypothetical protein